jgi:hypothetical protein
VDRLASALSGEPRAQAVAVFEPEGLAHQSTEAPRVGRAVFASLEKVRSEFPVVESETLGWGIEPPEALPGGSFATLVHFELTPGLVRVNEACEASGSRLRSAWSAHTAAVACLRAASRKPRSRAVLLLLPDYVAVAGCAPGRRSYRSWPGPLAERDWLAVAAFTGEPGEGARQGKADPEGRRAPLAVVAHGDPSSLCPFWAELRDAGRLEAVLSLDDLAAAAEALSPSHPANLALGLPSSRDLDSVLRCTGLCSATAAVALFAVGLGEGRNLKRTAEADAVSEARAGARLESLERNREEMGRLIAESPDAAGTARAKRFPELLALASAVPDSVVLSGLLIGEDDSFEIEARLTGGDFDAEAARRALLRAGFAAAGGGAWILDKSAGRLSVRGRIQPPLP